MDISEGELAQVKEEKGAIFQEVIDNDIKPVIVKEEPREPNFFIKCEICNVNSDNEIECVHVKNDGLGGLKETDKLEEPSLSLVDGPHSNNSFKEDVEPKEEDSIMKLIDEEVTVKEEEYLDSPEYLSTEMDFVECDTGKVKTEDDNDIFYENIKIESMKEELTDNEASMSSDMFAQDEDSNEDVQPGTSKESTKGKMVDDLPFRLDELRYNSYADLTSDEDSLVDYDEVFQSTFMDQENCEMNPEVDGDITSDWDTEDELSLADFRDVLGDDSAKRIHSKWSKNNSVVLPAPMTEDCSIPDFVRVLDSPYQLFSLFISDDLIDDIIFQTNLYAEQIHGASGCSYKRTMNVEIRAFLGINILMGIKRSPSYRDYWSSAPDLRDPYISSIMDVKRFGWLLSHLHLNDNSAMPKRGDKLYKVKPFLDKIQNKFLKCCKPGEVLAVGESVIKFSGRSSLKRYVPKNLGYKVWVLADKSGYCYRFQLDAGKTGLKTKKSLGGEVVKMLCAFLEYTNRKIFIYNYFTSVSLMEDLKLKGINSCGAISRSGKELPAFKGDNEMKRGEYDYSVSGRGVAAIKWKENRCVHLVSNFHDPTVTTAIERRRKYGAKQDVTYPVLLYDYKQNMDGVYRLDRLKSAYEIDRKSHKWWHRIFFHFIDICVVNSFILYEKMQLPKKTLKNFRREVVSGLLSDTMSSASRKRQRSPQTSLTVAIKGHKPHVAKEIRTQNNAHQPMRTTRRRCGFCSDTKKQIRTEWMCQTCNVPLCISKNRNCYQSFHN